MWADTEIGTPSPIWDHSGIMIEAIPSWKYFVFGG